MALDNAIGFGAGDWLELALGAMLVLLILAWRPWIQPCARWLTRRPGWCLLLLAGLPVALRLILLPQHPVPSPNISDEFSHLLVADTLRHWRLANPPHSLHQFFETLDVLQAPSYSSIYPIGQGMVLTLGCLIFGLPWTGVVLSVAAFCTLCFWMLRAWTSPAWALAGALLAVFEFGPLNEWMNGYWGGGVSAAGGCLVFGALPRVREGRTRDAVLLALGVALVLLTRPYESILLVVSVLAYFAPSLLRRDDLRKLTRAATVAALVVVPAVSLTLLQNRQVTGSWTTLPYMLSRYEYGVPATFTFQPNPVPHRELTPEQQLEYKMQAAYHGSDTDTIQRYLGRLEYRVRFYRFFFLAPLYLALPAFFAAMREWRFAWVVLTLAVVALGANFYPFFFPHYIAAFACLLVLLAVTGLERMSRLTIRGWPAGREAARLLLLLSTAHFAFWYGAHVIDQPSVIQYETWDAINHGDPQGRAAVQNRLAQAPGKQLVFVRYWLQHIFQNEWIYNEADIDSARVVWARDLSATENENLRRYFSGRTVWLLEPDARPPHLAPYPLERASNGEAPR